MVSGKVIRDHLLAGDVFYGFFFANDLWIALHVNQNNVWSQGNELHPLGHIIGSNALDHEMVSLLEKWKSYGLPVHEY